MVHDSRGEYDQALVNRLIPKMKKYKVQAYFQAHRHTMEHNQANDADIHYFTIGAGALITFDTDKKPTNNQCYFQWFSKEGTFLYSLVLSNF